MKVGRGRVWMLWVVLVVPLCVGVGLWGVVNRPVVETTTPLPPTLVAERDTPTVPSPTHMVLPPSPTVLVLVESPTSVPSVVPSAVPSKTPTVVPPTPTLTPTRPGWEPLPPLPLSTTTYFEHGERDNALVALTFDVGQTVENPAGFDQAIIRVLTETQTPATFFLGGLWMEQHITETLLLANEPLFELGNHAWSHLDFASIDRATIDDELLLTQQTMFRLLGWQTTLFRFPYGTYNEVALAAVAENGLYAIQWDVVSGDPDPAITAEAMVPWVLQQTRPGSIIIMHANGRGWNTAEALPAIIQTLREQGYTFVTVSQLLELPR